MAAPQHVLLAVQAFAGPGRAVLQLARRLHRARHLDEQLQRGLGIGNDAEIRAKNPADLGRLDIDMDEFAALGVDLDRAGVPIGPAIADAQHEVGFEEGRVAVAVAGLQPDHAGHQGVIVGNRAPSHQGRDHRNAGNSANSTRGREASALMMPPPATISGRSDAFSISMARSRLRPRGRRLIDGQGLIGFDVEFDLRDLHVDRQIDQHRSWAARTHDVERLLENHRNKRRFPNGHRPFRDRLGDRLDIDRLKILLVELRARRLAGDAEDRDRIGASGVEAR